MPLAATNSKTIFVTMVDTFIVRPTMNRVAKFPSASRVSGPVVAAGLFWLSCSDR